MKSLPSAAMICTFWLMYGSIGRYQTGWKRPLTSSGTQLVRCGLAAAIGQPALAFSASMLGVFATSSAAGMVPPMPMMSTFFLASGGSDHAVVVARRPARRVAKQAFMKFPLPLVSGRTPGGKMRSRRLPHCAGTTGAD